MKENAFIVVPHQDDETNLAGNCIAFLLKNHSVYVIYSSIDTDPKRAEIRKKEAFKACAVLGVPEERILFLDYPDTPNNRGKHFFQEDRSNVIERLENLIEQYRPAVILGTDFDFHSDHRMLSLALDTALGRVVRKHRQGYCPYVLKGFCYETAYYGVRDYFSSRNARTVHESERLSNPSYVWEKRISLPDIENKSFIWNKRAYKALKQHKSQFAVLMTESVLNRDNVFWRRRTDNLLLSDECKVSCSSGDASKLNDFLILDTDDIVTEDPTGIDYSRAIWKPDPADTNPKITVSFSHKVPVKNIVLHGNIQDKEEKKINGWVTIDDQTFGISGIQPFGRDTSIEINSNSVGQIQLHFPSDIELSEIEIFSDKGRTPDALHFDKKLLISSKRREHFKIERMLFLLQYLYVKVKKRIWYEKNKGWLEA